MRSAFPFSVIAATLIGCANEAPEGPPTVKYGHAECAGCGMIVSNERYAAAAVLPPEERNRELIFDDINCLLEYENAHPLPPAARRYVHDANTLQWVPASEAVFVRNPEVHTPMGSGLQAFARSTTTMPASLMNYEQLRTAANVGDDSTTKGLSDVLDHK